MFNHVEYIELLLLLLLHPFNGLFSRTTCLSWFQKGKTCLDLTEARWRGFGMQWHQLDHMQTICTLLQTDNHTNTSSFKFTDRALYLTPKQPCQSTEGIVTNIELIPKCSNAKLNLTSCICTSITNYKKNLYFSTANQWFKFNNYDSSVLPYDYIPRPLEGDMGPPWNMVCWFYLSPCPKWKLNRISRFCITHRCVQQNTHIHRQTMTMEKW